MGIIKRTIVTSAGATAALALIAGSVSAHECFNASKKYADSGAQLVLGPDDAILWATPGLQNRFDRGIVGPDGEGFHGIIAFDLDADGNIEDSTWLGVGPDGEIPLEAQYAGPVCRGLTNIVVYLEQCDSGG